MASLIRGIGNGFIGTYNTIVLGCDKFSQTTLWQKTGGIGVRCIRYGASFYPHSLRFNPITVEYGAGFTTAALIGAGLNLYEKRKKT
jgi:hypothetical protein